MTHDRKPSGEHTTLSAVIAAYLEEIDAGKLPDRAAWLDRYPELAGPLREFFATQDQLEKLAGPLRQAAPPSGETVAPAA